MRRSELTFIMLTAVVVGAGLLLDVVVTPRDAAQPASGSEEFISTGWYCPVPPGDGIQATMSTSNQSESSLGIRRSAVGGTSQSAPEQVAVPPRHTSNKAIGDFGLADATGLVEAFGGATSTHLMVLSQGVGVASSRCSAQPASRWLFATASTVRGENHTLLVSNPFQEEAVVSVRFLAGDQELEPANLRDRVIRTNSQVAFNLADVALEMPGFGLEVTASRGRVIASRYSHITVGDGRGLSLDVGMQAPSTTWLFAEGRVPDDGEEAIVLINPSDREALVGMVVMTDEDRTAPPGLAELPVPAGRQVVVNLSDHIERRSSYGIELVSTNGVPVVAERRTAGVVSGNRSYESTFGVTSVAQRWSVSAGSPSGGDSSLAMVNAGQVPTTVTVTMLTEEGESSPDELSSITVGPGRKVVVDLTPHTGGGLATALVVADQPVLAVESRAVVGTPFSEYATTAGQRMP